MPDSDGGHERQDIKLDCPLHVSDTSMLTQENAVIWLKSVKGLC